MTTTVVFFDLFETLITEGEVSPPAGIPEDVYRRVRRESRHAAMTGRMSYADILRAAGADESTVEESDARRTTEKRAFLTKRGSVTFVRVERTNATPDSNQPTSYFSSQSQTTRP
jgi:hypothetical protein